jgi:hypothetical protein
MTVDSVLIRIRVEHLVAVDLAGGNVFCLVRFAVRERERGDRVGHDLPPR